jgi:hypothetical protein
VVALLKLADLHFFMCPSADSAMLLFGTMDLATGRFSEALDQTDDGDDEETDDEEWHGNTSLTGNVCNRSVTLCSPRLRLQALCRRACTSSAITPGQYKDIPEKKHPTSV